jgi:PAS domain-containing protein
MGTDDIELLRDLVRHVPAVLWVEAYSDAQPSKSIPIYYSEGSEVVTGYRPHDWFDDPELWLKIIHPEDQQRVVTETWESSMHRKPFASDFRILRPDGRPVLVREKATVVRDDDRDRDVWYGITMDVGEPDSAG